MSCLFLVLTLLLPTSARLAAQGKVLNKQKKDNSAIKSMTPAELAELGDPLFNLVLKNNPGETNLAKVEALLQPDPAKRSLFVIHEEIVDPRLGQSRRAVITFSGTAKNGEVLDTNVMLSASFNSSKFPVSLTGVGDALQPFVEGWGWDSQRGRYNYYKLDGVGKNVSWKFRGSSVGADQLSLADRTGTCFACHINGAPVMKELLRPWINWVSGESSLPYLKRDNPKLRWPVTADSRFDFLREAETLERMIIPAINQFNRQRILNALKRNVKDGNIEEVKGLQEVLDGKRLLRHLFFTTEFNMISARKKSGLHPLPMPSGKGFQGSFEIPNSFFLNANLIFGGGDTGYAGLIMANPKTFGKIPDAALNSDDYKKLVADAKVKLNDVPGDADFCWLVPEPSHIDNDMVDQLVKKGIVTPHFVAAVLAVDLENPVLSKDRELLLQFVPDRFRFKPLADGDDAFNLKRHQQHELTKQVIAAIGPKAPESARKFAAVLKAENAANTPVKQLEKLIAAYNSRLEKSLSKTDPKARAAELRRLYQIAIDRRRAVLADPSLQNLDETGGKLLFPLP